MKCPRCSLTLKKRRFGSGSVYSCPLCSGFAATLSFVRRLVPGDIADQFWPKLSGFLSSHDPCVACRSLFSEVAITTKSGVVHVDVCRNCHMVWFDAAEIALTKMPGSPLEAMESSNASLEPDLRRELLTQELAHAREVRQALDVGDVTPDGTIEHVMGVFGLPVERGAPAVTRYPKATLMLVFLCCIGTLGVSMESPGAFVREWGFLPSDPFRYMGLTILTSIFVHSGILHLVANGYCLFLFGDNVEEKIGARNFTVLFLTASISGLATHMLFDPRPGVPCVGASAGVFGMMVLYG